jgi:hypothetical protein
MEGSIINSILGEGRMPPPSVGMGVTLLHYTDRSPATIVRVSSSGRVAWIQEDTATRTDKHGMSECQTYSFEANPNNPVVRINLTKKGWKVANGPRVRLGHREKYHDFSF